MPVTFDPAWEYATRNEELGDEEYQIDFVFNERWNKRELTGWRFCKNPDAFLPTQYGKARTKEREHKGSALRTSYCQCGRAKTETAKQCSDCRIDPLRSLKIERTCGECGKPYLPNHVRQLCCSRDCAVKRLGYTRRMKECQQCNQPFWQRNIGAIYCSHKCDIDRRNIRLSNINCKKCGKNFKPRHRHIKFCSRKCRGGRPKGVANKFPCSRICGFCKKPFIALQARYKFCSIKCSSSVPRNPLVTCRYCGESFRMKKKGRLFCQMAHYLLWRKTSGKISPGA